MSRLSCLLLASLLLLSACYSPRTEIELYYPRKDPLDRFEMHDAISIIEVRPSLHVLPFEDMRPWSRVGESRTDWGFHIDVIEPRDSVVEWFSASLAEALSERDYRVFPPDEAEVTVGGKLRRLFVAKRFFYEAQLELLLVVRCSCHHKILLTKELKLAASLDGDLKDAHGEALASAIDHAGDVIALELAHLRRDALHRAPPRNFEDELQREEK